MNGCIKFVRTTTENEMGTKKQVLGLHTKISKIWLAAKSDVVFTMIFNWQRQQIKYFSVYFIQQDMVDRWSSSGTPVDFFHQGRATPINCDIGIKSSIRSDLCISQRIGYSQNSWFNGWSIDSYFICLKLYYSANCFVFSYISTTFMYLSLLMRTKHNFRRLGSLWQFLMELAFHLQIV